MSKLTEKSKKIPTPFEVSEFKKTVRGIEFYCMCEIFEGSYVHVCNEHNASLDVGDEW